MAHNCTELIYPCKLDIKVTSAIQIQVSKTKKLYSNLDEITTYMQNKKMLKMKEQSKDRPNIINISPNKKIKKNLELINNIISETNTQNKILEIYSLVR